MRQRQVYLCGICVALSLFFFPAANGTVAQPPDTVPEESPAAVAPDQVDVVRDVTGESSDDAVTESSVEPSEPAEPLRTEAADLESIMPDSADREPLSRPEITEPNGKIVDANEVTGEPPEPPPSEQDPTQTSAPSLTVAVAQDSSSATNRPSLSDRKELAAFIDGVLEIQRAVNGVAGATVAVVVGNEVAYAKGYGYADVENRIPVDAGKTMFRIGSVSKLFIWTAAMQLVEQGKIDLNEDINVYLAESGVKVPRTFDTPITMKDLMNHTPGFEDVVIGLFARDHKALKPIAKLLQDRIPARVRPPGDLASYSNHGTVFAAVVIEQVTGMTWEDYVEQNILAPLDMNHTSVRQPETENLPDDLSVGYKYSNNEFEAVGYEYIPAAPAGCISSSAEDMARFMIAHMNRGQSGGVQILKPETIDQMHSRSQWHDERINAMCHGFWESRSHGQRLLEHGGDTNLFHSQLTMIPDEQVGLFVSYNTDTGTGLREKLRDAFLDRYFPVDQVKRQAPSGFRERARRFTGPYKLLRYDHSTFAKLSVLFQVVEVSATDDDRLRIGGRPFVEVAPLLFAEQSGAREVAFREDEAGNITHLFLNEAPPMALQKMRWYESPNFQLLLFIANILVFLSVFVGWPFVYAVTRGELIAGREPTLSSRFASWFAWFGAAGFLALLAMIGSVAMDTDEVVFGVPQILQDAITFSPLCILFAGGIFVLALLSWVGRYWRLTGRLHYLLLALASIGFTWQLYFWNLLKLNV